MVGWPIRLLWFELYMFGIPDIYHCGPLTFTGIFIAAKAAIPAIMPWTMIDRYFDSHRKPALAPSKTSAEP